VERLRLCPHCRGFLTIATEAEGRSCGYQSAFAAALPSESCPKCRHDARDAVLAAKRQGKHQHYIIQDKENDLLERV